MCRDVSSGRSAERKFWAAAAGSKCGRPAFARIRGNSDHLPDGERFQLSGLSGLFFVSLPDRCEMHRAAGSRSQPTDRAVSDLNGEGRERSSWLGQSDQSIGIGSHRPIRAFVVEDDPIMRNMVCEYLEQHNIHAVAASGRQEMSRYLAGGEPSLIILDLRLDQEDGLELLREIRSRSDTPVIIITGDRREEIDRVVGLELGADDYITKPFSLRELLARIRAILRRQEAGRAASQRDPDRGRYKFGDWQPDRRGRRLIDVNGTEVALTKGEYALLTAFMDAPQRPLSREHLLQATRVHEDIFDRSIDVQILRLRRKLEPDPSAPSIIRTERGVGYVFALPVEPA
jgi:two-component system, OmpR family, response regulator